VTDRSVDRRERSGALGKRKPGTVPRAAIARPIPGVHAGADYFVGGYLVARVYLHPTGAIDWETHYDDAHRLHGIERQEFEDGRIKYRARWVHGLQHGLQQQWDQRGLLLVHTRFVHGTGTDLWFDCGCLKEERHYVHGLRHGVERWWRDRKTVWHEIQLRAGLKHGIEREWNALRRLCRGFPKYFLNDAQVSRRAYERACRADQQLPVPRSVDNLRRAPTSEGNFG
jgi:hypothetical protein